MTNKITMKSFLKNFFSLLFLLFLSAPSEVHSSGERICYLKLDKPDKKKFLKYKQEGDDFFTQKKYKEALASYTEALKYVKKPDAYVVSQIKQCKGFLNKFYTLASREGNVLFKSGKINQAIEKYREALSFKDNKKLTELIDEYGSPSENTFYTKLGGSSYDDVRSVLYEESEQVYYMVGKALASDVTGTDVNFLKIDTLGKLVMNKTYGEEQTDEGKKIIKATGDTYFIMGNSERPNELGTSLPKGMLINIDKTGKDLWTKYYQPNIAGTVLTDFNVIIPAKKEGEFLIAGSVINLEDTVYFDDNYLLKVNQKGEKLWEKVYQDSTSEHIADIQAIDSGYILLVNEEYQRTRGDIVLTKIDEEGNIIWKKRYGGNQNEIGNRLLKTDDGGYVFTGLTYSFAEGSHDIWVVKTDAEGEKEWDKAIGDLSTDEGMTLASTKDGGYILAGYMELWIPNKLGLNTNKEKLDAFVAKLSGSGEILWTRLFGGLGDQRLFDLTQNADGTYMSVGYHQDTAGADILLIKFDKKGLVKDLSQK